MEALCQKLAINRCIVDLMNTLSSNNYIINRMNKDANKGNFERPYSQLMVQLIFFFF